MCAGLSMQEANWIGCAGDYPRGFRVIIQRNGQDLDKLLPPFAQKAISFFSHNSITTIYFQIHFIVLTIFCKYYYNYYFFFFFLGISITFFFRVCTFLVDGFLFHRKTLIFLLNWFFYYILFLLFKVEKVLNCTHFFFFLV